MVRLRIWYSKTCVSPNGSGPRLMLSSECLQTVMFGQSLFVTRCCVQLRTSTSGLYAAYTDNYAALDMTRAPASAWLHDRMQLCF